jgi:ADP-ribosylglycohydrolase
LACCTIEGIIRASIRSTHKGVCHPPSVVWHAYHRWAALQGIPDVRRWRESDWPDGWLARVPALTVRRGSAPATVAALQAGTMGTSEKPVGTSVGAHGLTRSLPAGLCLGWGPAPGSFGAEIAALTHGPEAIDAATLGSAIISGLGQGRGVDDAVRHALRHCAQPAAASAGQAVTGALAAAASAPAQAAELARLAPDARAVSALAGAVYVAASLPHRERVRDALPLAASAGDGGHVATVTGALLGAAYGVDALPVDWLARLELVWVADTLARDLVAELADGPSGTGYTPATDPHWWDRYPGW